MKPPDTSNLIAAIGTVISAVSAGVASAAIRSSRKTAKEQAALAEKQSSLQAKLTAIEEERREEERERRQQEDEARRLAWVDTRVERRIRYHPEWWELIVVNRGLASARHIAFSLESINGGDAPWIVITQN